jgi:hypothetical protein
MITEEPYKGDTSGKTFTKFEVSNPITILRSVATRQCVAATAHYNLSISFSNGIQKGSYKTGQKMTLPLRTTKLADFDFRPMHLIQEYVNLLAIIDSLRTNLDSKARILNGFTFDMSDLENLKIYNLTDGKNYKACIAKPATTLGMKGKWTPSSYSNLWPWAADVKAAI